MLMIKSNIFYSASSSRLLFLTYHFECCISMKTNTHIRFKRYNNDNNNDNIRINFFDIIEYDTVFQSFA